MTDNNLILDVELSFKNQNYRNNVKSTFTGVDYTSQRRKGRKRRLNVWKIIEHSGILLVKLPGCGAIQKGSVKPSSACQKQLFLKMKIPQG